MTTTILILEPPGKQFGSLRRDFRAEAAPDWDVRLVSSIEELLDQLADPQRHCLVILPNEIDGDWESALRRIATVRQAAPDAAVVITADAGDVDLAARAIEAGATDFLVRGDRLRQRIATLLGKLRGLFDVIDRNRRLDEHNAQLREAIQARLKLVGESPQIRSLLDQIRRVAEIPRPLLIVGERGTGKELVARAIHFAGGPPTRPIVTVNCAAFNDALLESELFGHEQGAFTGADSRRRGKFEQADGGTLFLDEIGNMSTAFQEKILRVTEYGVYTRVGGTVELTTSARIIAATNRNLREMIAQGTFLADLYDRLAFETLDVPPLRQRVGDIEVLARYFLSQFAREIPAFRGKTLSPEAVRALRNHRFAGNVRELKNIIERAAYRETADQITAEDLGLGSDSAAAQEAGSFSERMEALGRRLITDALRRAGGNQAAAARDLGLSYHQFRYHARKYGKERRSSRS